MNPAKRALSRTKTFVVNHKTAIAVAATAVICVAAHLAVVRNTNERLEEMGISTDEFYNTES
jgi:hypothetical protein